VSKDLESLENDVSGLRATKGDDDLETLEAMYRLAHAYTGLPPELRSDFDLEQALALMEVVVERLTRRYGRDHDSPTAATVFLGTILHALGRLEEAKRLWERVLALWELDRGVDDLSTIGVAHNLALLANDEGDYNELVVFQSRVVDSLRRVGADQLSYLRELALLAYGQRLSFAFEEARETDDERVRIWRDLRGPDSKDTLEAEFCLAIDLGLCGNLETARSELQHLAIRAKSLLKPGDELRAKIDQQLAATSGYLDQRRDL